MSAYCTIEHLLDRISRALLITASDHENEGILPVDNINRIIEDQSARINHALAAGGCAIPIADAALGRSLTVGLVIGVICRGTNALNAAREKDMEWAEATLLQFQQGMCPMVEGGAVDTSVDYIPNTPEYALTTRSVYDYYRGWGW